MFKKIFSAIMAVVLVVGLYPTIALADESINADNGAEDVAAVETFTEDASVASSCDVPVSTSSFVTPLTDDDVISGTLGTCTWTLKNNVLTISPTDGVSGTFTGSGLQSRWPWDNYRSSIAFVKFDPGIKAEGSFNYMFSYCGSLTFIDLSDLDTSDVTSMYSMFFDCESLASVDFSGFDLSSVTDMHYMFGLCGSLASVDFPGCDLSSVTDMSRMFANCYLLSSVDFSGFDLSSVTDMSRMFGYCSSLTSIDFSDCDLSSATDMTGMFFDCSSLTLADFSSSGLSSATDMHQMFSLCSSLTVADFSDCDLSSVLNMSQMFNSCRSLTTVDFARVNSNTVVNMSSMFSNCTYLAYLDISGLNTSFATNMSSTFDTCTGLRTVIVGEGFVFNEPLPIPIENKVNGWWISDTGTVYEDPTDIPNNVAATYTAVFPANTTTLETAIQRAEELNSSDYTAASWENLQVALDDAKRVLQDKNAAQSEVDSAANTLIKAIDSLVISESFMTIYAGVDRYATANLISSGVSEAGTYEGVIVCSAANGKFADALCASGLSGVLNYPIVLVNGSVSTLDEGTKDLVSDLVGGKGDIIILGGTSTVKSGIRSLLARYDSDGDVTRISGDDRYATAQAIYEYGEARGGWSTDYAVLAKGNDFPDALGAASFCTTNAAPMLLTDQNSETLSGYVTNAAISSDEIVIVGGTSSVSTAKENTLRNYATVERFGEATRYETNLAFARWQLNHGMSIDSAGIATGTNFPDSLGSSYLLSLTSSVLLLTSKTESENAALYDILSDNAQAISNINVFGGENSVSADTRTAIQSAIGGEWTTINK